MCLKRNSGCGQRRLCAQQVEPLQLAQRLAQLLLAAGDAREQREAEVAAEHRRGGQRLAALGG